MQHDIIITGDSKEVLKTFPPDCIDLTVTSPPYDNLRDYHGYTFDFESIAQELYRVTKVGGVIVWIVNDATINGSETGTSFRQALYFMQCGFNLHDTMIFEKTNPISLTHNRYEQYFEYMFVFSKKRLAIFNPILEKCIGRNKSKNREKAKISAAMRSRKEVTTTKQYKYAGNIWEYPVGVSGDTGDHPAPFPEELARDHILSWSNRGDLILDPFCGSGTTCKEAKLNGRNYIGIEISPEYSLLAEKRVKKAAIKYASRIPDEIMFSKKQQSIFEDKENKKK